MVSRAQGRSPIPTLCLVCCSLHSNPWPHTELTKPLAAPRNPPLPRAGPPQFLQWCSPSLRHRQGGAAGPPAAGARPGSGVRTRPSGGRSSRCRRSRGGGRPASGTCGFGARRCWCRRAAGGPSASGTRCSCARPRRPRPSRAAGQGGAAGPPLPLPPSLSPPLARLRGPRSWKVGMCSGDWQREVWTNNVEGVGAGMGGWCCVHWCGG